MLLTYWDHTEYIPYVNLTAVLFICRFLHVINGYQLPNITLQVLQIFNYTFI